MHREHKKLVEALKSHGYTISLAESMTAGMAANFLSNVKGTADIFRGSVVCYHPAFKNEVLRVPAQLIKKYTAESQQVTNRLARGLKKLVHSDVYAAITGLAAPGGSETKQKPVGTVFYSVIIKNKQFRKRILLRGSPKEIKEKSCFALFQFIISLLRRV